MTKPNFIRKRLILLFESDNIIEQQKIVDNYNKIRENKCYCGHTDECSCGDPGISEFKSALLTNSIPETILSMII
jgi:hypothetical protein